MSVQRLILASLQHIQGRFAMRSPGARSPGAPEPSAAQPRRRRRGARAPAADSIPQGHDPETAFCRTCSIPNDPSHDYTGAWGARRGESSRPQGPNKPALPRDSLSWNRAGLPKPRRLRQTHIARNDGAKNFLVECSNSCADTSFAKLLRGSNIVRSSLRSPAPD